MKVKEFKGLDLVPIIKEAIKNDGEFLKIKGIMFILKV